MNRLIPSTCNTSLSKGTPTCNTSLSQDISCTINFDVGVTASTNPTKIEETKGIASLECHNQMGNRPSRTGTIGVDRPSNQICHILIKIQSLYQKKKKKKKKKERKILQQSSSHYKDSIFISKN